MTVSTAHVPPIPSSTPVRYIKLGGKGSWEKECFDKSIILYGFNTNSAERFPLCIDGRWDDLKKSFLKKGRAPGTAANITNQTKQFFEDDGATLWITFSFVNHLLYWGFLDKSTQPAGHDDRKGVWQTVTGGWRKTDRNGKLLTADRLPSSLTKLLAHFRGTSCIPGDAKSVIRLINGEKDPL